MKIKDVRPEPYTKQLRCDRCGLLSEDGDVEFSEFLCIDTRAGYGSIFGDGNGVQIDLCQHCVKALLGGWLRVCDPDDHARELQELLDRFNPERHRDEFPATEPGETERRLELLTEKRVTPEGSAAPRPLDVVEGQPYWNLRVIQFDAGEDSYSAVHEVYYEADGRLRCYSKEPAIVMWTVDDEDGAPTRTLERFRRAVVEPWLKATDFTSA